MDNINPINKASQTLFKRYNSIVQEAGDKLPSTISMRLHLLGIHAISHPEMPIDKMSRWLGFVQGVLYANGLINIDTERNISRDLFQIAYGELDIDIPETIDVLTEALEALDTLE